MPQRRDGVSCVHSTGCLHCVAGCSQDAAAIVQMLVIDMCKVIYTMFVWTSPCKGMNQGYAFLDEQLHQGRGAMPSEKAIKHSPDPVGLQGALPACLWWSPESLQCMAQTEEGFGVHKLGSQGGHLRAGKLLLSLNANHLQMTSSQLVLC